MTKIKYIGILLASMLLIAGFSTSGYEVNAQLSHNRGRIKHFSQNSVHPGRLELIRPDTNNSFFVGAKSGRKFIVWGLNYDHDVSGRLLEDYWFEEWENVENDFREMKDLGANVVRIHLQLPRFMKSPESVDKKMLSQLKRLLALAEGIGLYLDITGLGCYHKEDVPEWYDALDEQDRWAVQGLFWEAISKTCKSSSAIFCYDLMNEPVFPGDGKQENEWLAGELGGKYFVQRITLDLAGRTRDQVANEWINKLAGSIRKYDKHHMITIGEIPWAYTFPGARSFFHSGSVGKNLDFVSVHFYPKKDDVPAALKALNTYNLGKPIVIEEMFPLSCSITELDTFIDGSREIASGWIGFYWGYSIEDFRNKNNLNITEALIKSWLEYFQAKSKEVIESLNY